MVDSTGLWLVMEHHLEMPRIARHSDFIFRDLDFQQKQNRVNVVKISHFLRTGKNTCYITLKRQRENNSKRQWDSQ